MSFEERVKLYEGQTFHEINICGLNRILPIIEVSKGIRIASDHQLVLGRDIEFTSVVSEELARRIEQYNPDYLFTAESKGLCIAYETGKRLKHSGICVARKGKKAYMINPLEVEIESITTKEPQMLVLEEDEAKRMYGRKVVPIDDVVSTGETMRRLKGLVQRAGGKVVCEAAVWLEGPWYRGEDLICLGILPIFVSEEIFHELKKEWYDNVPSLEKSVRMYSI